MFALLGPNGAGKTTALKMVAGLLRPDAGAIRIFGIDAAADPLAAKRITAWLPDEPLIYDRLTPWEHLDFVAGLWDLPARDAEVRAEALLRRLDLWEVRNQRCGSFSRGMKQKTALAAALLHQPRLLLLDEPLTGLDVAVASAIRKVLRRVLARDGRSAVLVTHDLLDVVTLADRVVVLEAGRVVESGTAAETLAKPRSFFGARFAGVNLVAGRIGPDGSLATSWGTTWHGTVGDDVGAGDAAVAIFAPSTVAVHRDKPHGSPRNTIEVVVAELDTRGPAIRVRAEEQPDGAPGLAADITVESATDLRLAPGERVYFAVKSQEITVHPGP
jgi:molybdate transport system ATP-binding protein